MQSFSAADFYLQLKGFTIYTHLQTLCCCSRCCSRALHLLKAQSTAA